MAAGGLVHLNHGLKEQKCRLIREPDSLFAGLEGSQI